MMQVSSTQATIATQPSSTGEMTPLYRGRWGYERLSNDRALRGISVAIQRAEIDDCAAETGEPVVGHLQDNNISASEYGTKPRDGYIDLLAHIMRNLANEIIITEVPRLCRQSEEALELIRLSKSTALRYIRTTDGMVYDLQTPRGRKSFREAVSDAEFESDQTSTRQGRRKNVQAAAGAFHGGQRPWAYEGAIYEKLATPDGTEIRGRLLNPGRVGVTIIEAEADARREGTRRLIAGEQEISIVRDFNDRGVSAPDGGKWRPGNFKRTMLRKRDVAFDEFPGRGTRLHKGQEYRAIWDAVISREDYELMAASMRLSGTGRKSGLANGRQYLLSGIACCTHHDHGPMYGKGRKQRDGTYIRRYGCRSQDDYGKPIPGSKTYRLAAPLDLWVGEAVLAALDSPEVMTALAPPEDRERTRELVDLHTKQQLHLKQLVVDYGAGILSRDDLVLAKQVAQTAFDQTTAELAAIQRQRASLNLPSGSSLRETYWKADIAWQRIVIKLVVERVIVHPGHPRSATWRGFHFNPDDVEIVWKV
jgi:DNA invertase Pin-like site-specific DNA recombinase